MPSSKPPQRLYRYQPFTAQALRNLKKRVVYFSSPTRFNDPFNCRYQLSRVPSSDTELQRFIEEYRAHSPDGRIHKTLPDDHPEARNTLRAYLDDACGRIVEETFGGRGVCCFAESWEDLLMWGHYADGHRGFCLEFSTDFEPFSGAMKVRYQEELPKLSPMQIFRDPKDYVFESLLATKALHWSYEHEWRVFHEAAGTEFGYGTDALTGLMFGAEMPFVDKELLALVVRGSGTQLYECKVSTHKYGLERQEVNYTPHPKAGGGA